LEGLIKKEKPIKKKARKILVKSIVSVLLFCYLIVLVLNIYLGRSLPKISGELKLTGLNAPVLVVRDENGVPHIQAENEHDLFLAQGFVQAQD
jgi:penicillin G amidase